MLADTWKGRKSFSPFFISDTYEMLHIVSFLKDCIYHWKNNIKDKIDKFICKKRVWRIYSDHCTLTKDALSLKPCNYKTSDLRHLSVQIFVYLVNTMHSFFRGFFGMSVKFAILFKMGNSKALLTSTKHF